jgi:hypothetical protein
MPRHPVVPRLQPVPSIQALLLLQQPGAGSARDILTRGTDMHRLALRSLSFFFAIAVVSASPIAARAQPAPGADYAPGELVTQYSQHGYQVDAPIQWWTTDQVTSLRVFDTRTDRVVIVLVYPNSGAADAERARAQAREASGSHLVPGYGLSTWHQNVALVESTQAELSRQYAAQQDRHNQMMLGGGGTDEVARAEVMRAVDLDILSIVDTGVVHL